MQDASLLSRIGLVVGLTTACGDPTSPPLPAGTFSATVRTGSASYVVGSDSSVWTSTGLGLFNAQFVAVDSVPGIPSPFTLVVVKTDSTLAGTALPPGNYPIAFRDSTLAAAAFIGVGFEWLADSGKLVVQVPSADTLFSGTLDAWFHDTRGTGGATYHVTARFEATPFR